LEVGRPYTVICPSLEGPVLEVLAHTTRPLTGREVARLASRGSERGVRLVLNRLVDQGLVDAREAGPSVLFVLNRDHVAGDLVAGLFELNELLIERIRQEFAQWRVAPVHASLFGSAARGDGGLDSDIDLLVIRPEEIDEDEPVWREQLQTLAEHVRAWSGNHASLHEVSRKQLRAAARRGEPIIGSLRESALTLAGADLSSLIGTRRSRSAA
jgi:predicted nucleotidyltransferase